MERVDVAIVGGGPAGASAAERAAAHGAETVLFEQGVPREDRDGVGPDSTDAAGMLDYWVDIMGFSFEEIPDDVVLRELEGTDFIGPSTRVELNTTGMDASYPKFGYTFNRTRMDDWLHERAAAAGADLRVGTGVKSVETDLSRPTPTHELALSNGEEIEAEYLVLADGPQRRVTLEALDQFTPAGTSISEFLSPPAANHIAYQEYREFPEECFEPDRLKFWWGYMPGETAYPWVFPNDGRVARVGLTMPIGMTLDDVAHPDSYKLLRPDDDGIPSGGEYVRRLLELEYGEYDVESDFPLVEDRGKSKGTETYPISSTRPIESPVGANVAVAGGAMGTTSAFHEGGYHVAVRTGKIAGRLAATGSVGNYNDVWKRAIGDEILRNVAFADIVADYEPDDWDRTFDIVSKMQGGGAGGRSIVSKKYSAGVGATKILAAYKRRKFRYRDGRYVQFREDQYVY